MGKLRNGEIGKWGKLKNWEIETCRNREMEKKEKVEKLKFFKKNYKHLMTRSNLPVDFDGQAVAEFCKLRGIRRLRFVWLCCS